jgi:hypothetical protein
LDHSSESHACDKQILTTDHPPSLDPLIPCSLFPLPCSLFPLPSFSQELNFFQGYVSVGSGGVLASGVGYIGSKQYLWLELLCPHAHAHALTIDKEWVLLVYSYIWCKHPIENFYAYNFKINKQAVYVCTHRELSLWRDNV